MHESIQMSQMLYTGISTNNFPHGTVTQKGHGQKCLNRQSSRSQNRNNGTTRAANRQQQNYHQSFILIR